MCVGTVTLGVDTVGVVGVAGVVGVVTEGIVDLDGDVVFDGDNVDVVGSIPDVDGFTTGISTADEDVDGEDVDNAHELPVLDILDALDALDADYELTVRGIY